MLKHPMPKHPNAMRVYYFIKDWKETMTPEQFHARLLDLVLHFQDLPGLRRWPYTPEPTPEACKAESGWYLDAGGGQWDLVLPDSRPIEYITLAGMNIWLDNGQVQWAITNDLYEAASKQTPPRRQKGVRHPRATFIQVVWKIGTVDYFEPVNWAMLVRMTPQAVQDAASITKKRKAYTTYNGLKIPINYTTRTI